MEVALSAALAAAGIAMLCLGGNWLGSGGVSIARRYRVSSLVIGMTIVAYGTSTPELAASIAAAGEHGQVILGNVLGSNIANVGMVIGVSALLVPLAARAPGTRRWLLLMLAVSPLPLALSLDGEISSLDGLLLLAGLGAFAAYAMRSALRGRIPAEEAPPGRRGVAASAGLVALGAALLWAGALLAVENAVLLAAALGLTEKVIGLTVIAVGTSLPELVTSVISIRRGHADIGIGNIIGSNIYNILMILGLGAALGGIGGAGADADHLVMIVFAAALLAFAWRGTVARAAGACLAAGYAAYMVLLLIWST
ncbi:MAG: calcium/sodium antiporter [Nitrosopumilus sp.]|nr:calcium/sodium antiporter [Nitrosopumilus sp.]